MCSALRALACPQLFFAGDSERNGVHHYLRIHPAAAARSGRRLRSATSPRPPITRIHDPE